jgi:SAM-dependent methyltransferase
MIAAHSESLMPAVPARLRHRFVDLRTEGAGTLRETAAVGLGVFIGCIPLFGLHLAICWAVGYLLRLNRLKMYVAANISNPFVAPWLLFAEVQTGAWVRRGAFHALTPATFRETPLTVFGADVFVGSVFVGGGLAAILAAATYGVLRSGGQDPAFADLVRRAADRYAGASITAWEFARGKLRGDPVYRAALAPDALPSGDSLVDIGCGQGLTLVLLTEARSAFDAGRWPTAWPPPPRFDRLIGIELRRRVAAMAREALDGDAEIITADARTVALDRASAVLLFDVLHLMTHAEQERLLADLASRLQPSSVVLIREVDAAGGWRYTAVWLGNRLKALLFGTWRQAFEARTESDWRGCFDRCGFAVDTRPMAGRSPFANVLFRLTVKTAASAPIRPPVPAA